MHASSICLVLAVLGGAAACGPAKPAETPSHGGDEAAIDGGAPSSDTPPTSSNTEPSPPPATTPLPPMPPPAPTATGSGVPYDKDAVEVALKRAARQVKANCGAATDEEGKATGPWGKVNVNVKLGHNGHSQGATVEAPYDGKPVGNCINRAFAILVYPPFAGPDTTVDWPVEVVRPAH